MTPADRENRLRAMRANPGKGWRQVVREMAIWDEGHTAPAVELMKHEKLTAPKAIKQLEKDYATDRMRRVWREQVADELEEFGLGTNAQLDEAYDVYVDAFIAASRARVMRGLGVVNPAQDLKVGDRVTVRGVRGKVTRVSPRIREFTFLADGGSVWDENGDEVRYSYDEAVQTNPASVMTGPGWSSAREKLRSAASKKNPAYADHHLQRLSDDIARYMLIADQRPDGYTVSWWTPAEESECAARDYAMVDCEKADYRFSRKMRDLDYAHRMGVIAHEVGHVLAYQAWGDEREAAADRAALELLRVRISYDKAYGGKGLQTIKDLKENPASDDEQTEARDLYETFHRYPPTKIGEFARDFSIPQRMLRVGPALWTTYRSGKVDPATLKKPRRPVNYIHEHDAGVDVYVTIEDGAENGWSGTDSPYDDVTEGVEVPKEFLRAQALVKLGDSLGYKFRIGGDEIEAEAEDPLPELYSTPDGKCLLVIQDKRDVIAMIWGGALGVFARGIDG